MSYALRVDTVTVLVEEQAGAEYKPVEEMVPSLAFPPEMPFTDQLTAVLPVPVTVAENCCVCIPLSETLCGEMDTVTDPELLAAVVPEPEIVSDGLALTDAFVSRLNVACADPLC